MTPFSRLALLVLAPVALAVSACTDGGHFTILGYTTQPNYNTDIRTVRVPIFKNETFRQGLEFDLTRAVIREIEAKTPYKVVNGGADADTELTGTIRAATKALLTRNQQNEVREAEMTVVVEVCWRDLRSGEVLSAPCRPPDAPPLPPGVPQPNTTVQSVASFIPEIGESISTALQRNVDRLAIQIVSMMEKPW
jgi:hypothetical protein